MIMSNEHLKESDVSGLIIKTYYSVYNKLGYGFSSEIYKNGMASFLRQTSLKFEQNKKITVYHETDALELKSLNRMKNYLKISDYKIGFLMNFGAKPAYKRCDKIRKHGE